MAMGKGTGEWSLSIASPFDLVLLSPGTTGGDVGEVLVYFITSVAKDCKCSVTVVSSILFGPRMTSGRVRPGDVTGDMSRLRTPSPSFESVETLCPRETSSFR